MEVYVTRARSRPPAPRSWGLPTLNHGSLLLEFGPNASKDATVQRAVTARRAVTPPGIVGTRCVRGLVGSSSGAREEPRRVFLHVQLVLSQSQGRTGCPRVVQRFVKSPSPRKLSVLNSRRSTSDRDFYTDQESLQEIKTKMNTKIVRYRWGGDRRGLASSRWSGRR